MKWLINSNSLDDVHAAKARGIAPTAEQEQAFISKFGAAADGAPGIMSLSLNSAAIQVRGVLTDSPDWYSYYYGGGNTVYSDIITSLALSNANPSVDHIDMFVDSPGGHASASWLAVMEAIRDSEKPVNMIVGNMAASAAYGIVSVGQSIHASNRLSSFGSIGVVQTFRVSETTVDVTSSNAPNKRPDVTTDEGVKVVQSQLDEIETIFVDTIAAGRGTTVKDVLANFGQGGMFLAEEALSRGMIDVIVEGAANTTQSAPGGNIKGVQTMDLDELKAKHPGLHAQVLQIGATEERDRVNSHLILGKASGAMDVALAAIEDGSGMTATLNAKYLAAGMSKNNTAQVVGDDDDAKKALDGAAVEQTNANTEEDAVLALISANMGA